LSLLARPTQRRYFMRRPSALIREMCRLVTQVISEPQKDEGVAILARPAQALQGASLRSEDGDV